MICYLDIKAKENMIKEGLSKFPLETGGILCGYRCENGDYVITATIGPGPNAEHNKSDFLGDHKYQHEEFLKLWETSDQTLCYLGDWHIHPNGSSFPSNLDCETMKKIAVNLEAQCPNPLMLIIGNQVNNFEVWGFINGVFRGLVLKEFDYAKYLSTKEDK